MSFTPLSVTFPVTFVTISMSGVCGCVIVRDPPATVMIPLSPCPASPDPLCRIIMPRDVASACEVRCELLMAMKLSPSMTAISPCCEVPVMLFAVRLPVEYMMAQSLPVAV